MTAPAIFHLSFPVSSLAVSLAFYEACFGAQRGRSAPGWTDVIMFGHQLTLHELPAQVLPRELQGVRHFGVILDAAEFDATCERIAAARPPIEHRVLRRDEGLATEQAKLLVEDPDGHLIEVKTYRDPAVLAAPR